jgi:hypothetical protein
MVIAGMAVSICLTTPYRAITCHPPWRPYTDEVTPPLTRHAGGFNQIYEVSLVDSMLQARAANMSAMRQRAMAP